MARQHFLYLLMLICVAIVAPDEAAEAANHCCRGGWAAELATMSSGSTDKPTITQQHPADIC